MRSLQEYDFFYDRPSLKNVYMPDVPPKGVPPFNDLENDQNINLYFKSEEILQTYKQISWYNNTNRFTLIVEGDD